MVAVVELCKIPLATAYYLSQSKGWRVIFALGLCLLIAITFETVMNGLERNFTQRSYNISQERKNLGNTEEKISEIEREKLSIASLNAETIQKEFSEESASIQSQRQAELDNLDERERSLRGLYSNKARTALQSQLDETNKQLATITGQYNKRVEAIEADSTNRTNSCATAQDSQRNDLRSEIHSIRQSVAALDSQESKELADASLFTSSEGIKKRYADKRAPYLAELEKLQADLRRLSSPSAIQDLQAAKDRALDSARTNFERERRAIKNRKRLLESELVRRSSSEERVIRPKLLALDNERKLIAKKYED
jgi:hypothetical protein